MQVVMGDLTGYPQMRGKVMEGGQPWHFQTEVSGLSTGKRGDEGERTTLTFSKQKCQGCPRALCPFPDENGPGRAREDHWNTNRTVHSKNGQRLAHAYASCYGRLYRNSKIIFVLYSSESNNIWFRNSKITFFIVLNQKIFDSGIPKSYFYIVMNQTIFDSGIAESYFLYSSESKDILFMNSKLIFLYSSESKNRWFRNSKIIFFV